MQLYKIINDIREHYQGTERRPVFQLGSYAPLMIISQAPGKKVHETGIPWNDNSGLTLRNWLGVSNKEFYDPALFSIMPIDFCYPGKGAHGDLPPDRKCADRWHKVILNALSVNPLKLLIGSYAIDYYLPAEKKKSMADKVLNYHQYLPEYFPLPHPSPRNKLWMKHHPDFQTLVLPQLKKIVHQKINQAKGS